MVSRLPRPRFSWLGLAVVMIACGLAGCAIGTGERDADDTDSATGESAGGFAFRGRVMGPSPESMSGVSGRLIGEREYPFVTDRRGYFQVANMEPGSYRWTVQVPDGVLVPKQITEVNADTEAELRLIEATVVEIVVELPKDWDLGALTYRAISNEGQRFRLIPTGQRNIFWWPQGVQLGAVTGRGLAPGMFTVPTIGPGKPVHLRMKPGVRLTVHVLDADGNVAAGQNVNFDPGWPVELHELLRDWTVPENGPVVVDVAPGRYEVTAALADGSQLATKLELAEDQTITLRPEAK